MKAPQIIHDWLDAEYDKASKNPNVRTPDAYATYNLWQLVEAMEYDYERPKKRSR